MNMPPFQPGSRFGSGIAPGRCTCTILLTIVVLCTGAAPSIAAEDLVVISPRPGITMQILISEVTNAKAVVVLLPGGHGQLQIKQGKIGKLTGNFLVASRFQFNAQELTTALLDAPSDRQDHPGLTSKYRTTAQHAHDIMAAVAYLRERFQRQVWLIGTSRGSTSVAGVAEKIAVNGPDGIVLSASIGVAHHKGGTLRDFKLSRISIPTLVVHHVHDRCHVTPFAGAKRIYEALTSTKHKKLAVIRGGRTSLNKCSGSDHHGFMGVRAETIQVISDWIKAKK